MHFTILSTDRFSEVMSSQQMLEFKTLHETFNPLHLYIPCCTSKSRNTSVSPVLLKEEHQTCVLYFLPSYYSHQYRKYQFVKSDVTCIIIAYTCSILFFVKGIFELFHLLKKNILFMLKITTCHHQILLNTFLFTDLLFCSLS